MTVIWGTTFIVVKVAVESVDPLTFVAGRFVVGSVVLVAIYWRRLVGVALWRGGAILGLALFAGFAFQTYGLRASTPARAAFITGLNVVIVPILASVLTRQRFHRPVLFGIALSCVGMVVLSAPLSAEEWAGGSWVGDVLVLACALAFALHIVGVGHYVSREDVAALTTAQLLVVALLAAGASVVTGSLQPIDGAAWPAVAYMGVIATGLVFLMQNWAQKHTSATHTALIFALEPVFAALFSMLFYGEVLGLRALAGGVLIVAGIVIAELGSGRPTPPTE